MFQKIYKKEYKKDVYELEAAILPSEQTVAKIADRIIEFKRKE